MVLDELKSRSSDPALLERALLDCYGRFLVNIPEEEYHNPVRLCFHIQEAWWWYIDHWLQKYPCLLANYSLKSFIRLVSIDCELIRAVIGKVNLKQVENDWRQYRSKIPVRGGILINKRLDKVLLVRGFDSLQWTFPRGKADEQEDDTKCAIREIREETGIDVSKLIDPKCYLELFLNGRSVKLFIVFNVNELVNHKPLLVNEISECRWVSISLLRKKNNNIIKTFNVTEFIPDLVSFINKYRQKSRYKQTHNNNETIDKCSKSTKSDIDMNLGKGKWKPEDMFRINCEKFGVVSTYNIEHYNTVSKIPQKKADIRLDGYKLIPSKPNKVDLFYPCQKLMRANSIKEMENISQKVNKMKIEENCCYNNNNGDHFSDVSSENTDNNAIESLIQKSINLNFQKIKNKTIQNGSTPTICKRDKFKNGSMKSYDNICGGNENKVKCVNNWVENKYDVEAIKPFQFIMPYHSVLQSFIRYIK
ncbi:mRNA-decapping enzyme subunit 2 [Babesia microti strain RI]|uniref:mRNA-decapping enzyme subunit 2 n=1 Tax=Babesia microti (strain RI) TaxID=1133968 RepID=I7IPF6_BABMR|nr:mRNA-decapping enzyme subunit 2 [Babesia microti strain RI]CCF72915.1 mRNA-decapping enzyme subunit 2 [Babesia microti strain RI]|eukprot:XP_012647524.1 mRNA-decapping enzyme subunit 2 [Babesia microti strain RI]